MSFYPELDGLGLQDLVDALHRPAPEGSEYAATYYSEVTWRMRQAGETGNSVLWDEIDKANADRLRPILFALTAPATAHPNFKPLPRERLLELRDMLRSYLGNAEPLVVMEAVDGLRHLGEKGVADEVLALRDHPSPYVRGSVLRYMAGLWPDRSFPLLVEALSDPHFVVRESALDELGELGRPEALPQIQQLLTDDHPDVRQAAQTAVEALTGVQSP